ncbi:metallophosphoesterase family protein [Tardisphaera miroshnichenkoae]
MKICLSSDLHGEVKAASYLVRSAQALGCSVILIAGDLSSWRDAKSFYRVAEELSTFEGSVLAVLGNSDAPELLGVQARGVSLLHGTCNVVGGVGFVGVGGVPPSPYPSYFTLSEGEIGSLLERAADSCGERPLVSMTHVPPLGVLDSTRDGSSAGSRAVLNFIRHRAPLLHVAGHIHEAKGAANVGRTIVVNPGPLAFGDPIYVADVSNNGSTVNLMTP